MIPIQNERDERLVAIHDAPEHAAARTGTAAFALMLAEGPDGVLLVFNRQRQIWELPGGWVDEGETAADAAVRELREESGRTVADIRWQALLELECPARAGEPGPRRLSGALSHGRLTESRAPAEDDAAGQTRTHHGTSETTGVMFWTPGHESAGISAIDMALLQRFSSRRQG